jgi:hypothetical protein
VHRLVALGALTTHLVFVGFTVLGGFLACLVPWLVVPHVGAALWGGRMAATRAACPLSRMEDWGRTGSGRPTLNDRGFVAHYFEGRFYPAGWARRVEFLVGGVVVGSWLTFATR